MNGNPFSVLNKPEPAAPGQSEPGAAAVAAACESVAEMVRSAEVFVFMKGNPGTPMCGFSANTTAILHAYGAYDTFDVLSNPDIRAAAKQFAEWPTFPQVYVRGEFVGGNDIITDMHACGELGALLEGGSA